MEMEIAYQEVIPTTETVIVESAATGRRGKKNAKKPNKSVKDAKKEKRFDDFETSVPPEAEWAPAPDYDGFNERSQSIRALIEEKKSLIVKTSGEIEGLLKKKEKLQGELSTAFSTLSSIRNLKSPIFQEMKALKEKIDEEKSSRAAEEQVLRKMKGSLQFLSETEIDSACSQLDDEICSGKLSLREERANISRMKLLRSKKSDIRAYNQRLEAFKAKIDMTPKLQADRNSLKLKIQDLKSQESDINSQIDSLKGSIASVDVEIKSKIADKTSMFEDQTALKSELDEEHKYLRDSIQAFKMYSTWQKYQRWLQRKQEAKEREEQLALQKAQWEAEQALLDPYAEEKEICNSLSVYLKKFLDIGTVNSMFTETESIPTTSVTSSFNGQKLEEILTNTKVSDDNDEWGSLKREKKNKKKKSEKTRSQLTHSHDVFLNFDKLNLSAPLSVSDVPTSLESIGNLMRYYETAPHPREIKKMEKIAEQYAREMNERRERYTQTKLVEEEERHRRVHELQQQMEENMLLENSLRKASISLAVSEAESERSRQISELSAALAESKYFREESRLMALCAMQGELDRLSVEHAMTKVLNQMLRSLSIRRVKGLESTEQWSRVSCLADQDKNAVTIETASYVVDDMLTRRNRSLSVMNIAVECALERLRRMEEFENATAEHPDVAEVIALAESERSRRISEPELAEAMETRQLLNTILLESLKVSSEQE